MTVREPKKRSNLRLKLGGAYFSAQRKLRWLSMRKHFARECSGEDLAYQAFSHHTPLMRKLKDVDMQLQRNKVTNLRLACARLDGLLLRPGETMSYWYLIGKPTAGKGLKAAATRLAEKAKSEKKGSSAKGAKKAPPKKRK